jgi:hypothetical protein
MHSWYVCNSALQKLRVPSAKTGHCSDTVHANAVALLLEHYCAAQTTLIFNLPTQNFTLTNIVALLHQLRGCEKAAQSRT